jgi:hypothetical protein
MKQLDIVKAAALLIQWMKENKDVYVEITETRYTNGKLGTPADNYVINKAGDGFTALEDPKTVGRNLHKPITDDPVTVPAAHQNNDTTSVQERVEKVRNITEVHPRYYKYSSELINFILGDKRDSLAPWDLEEVAATKTKALQKERIEQVAAFMTGRLHTKNQSKVNIKSFMKKEPTNGFGAPRNISTLPVEHSLELAQYTLAFKYDVWKEQKWYMPGKTPSQISERLVEVANQPSPHPAIEEHYILEGDFNKYDGTLFKFTTEFDLRLYTAAFQPKYKDRVRLLWTREVDAKGMTATGYRYFNGHANPSGSDRTTDSNTGKNALIDYCALREAGLTAKEAWEMLAGYCGDDLFSRAPKWAFAKVVKEFGMSAKLEEHRPLDNPVVGFLGRKFPYLFEGGLESLQDPARLLRKLHLTFSNKMIPIMQAFANKATGLVTLDPNNPILQSWCAMAERLAKLEGAELGVVDPADIPYWHWALEESGTWIQVDADDYLDVIELISGITIGELRFLILQFDNVKCVEDLTKLIPVHVPTRTEDKLPAVLLNDDMASQKPDGPPSGPPKSDLRALTGSSAIPDPYYQSKTGESNSGGDEPPKNLDGQPVGTMVHGLANISGGGGQTNPSAMAVHSYQPSESGDSIASSTSSRRQRRALRKQALNGGGVGVDPYGYAGGKQASIGNTKSSQAVAQLQHSSRQDVKQLDTKTTSGKDDTRSTNAIGESPGKLSQGVSGVNSGTSTMSATRKYAKPQKLKHSGAGGAGKNKNKPNPGHATAPKITALTSTQVVEPSFAPYTIITGAKSQPPHSPTSDLFDNPLARCGSAPHLNI